MGLKTIFHIDESVKWSLLLKNAANLVQMADMQTAGIEVLANAESLSEPTQRQMQGYAYIKPQRPLRRPV
jgi:intracellular sulfur oxidation DsrE/DsrF family protein